MSGIIHGFDIDTNYFRGNAPEEVSIEACVSDSEPDANSLWETLLEQSTVAPHSQNLFEINDQRPWTHVRLNIFPDGGVARLRVYGDTLVNWDNYSHQSPVDLAAIKNGGKVLQVSDMFFSDKNNLIMPGPGINMGDGWETKRRRDAGNDWSIVKLGHLTNIEKVVIDTLHFKGNFPDSFMLEGCITDNDNFEALHTETMDTRNWQVIIKQTKLQADHQHIYIDEIMSGNEQCFTHLRLSIFPDGGISRMRVYGHPKSS